MWISEWAVYVQVQARVLGLFLRLDTFAQMLNLPTNYLNLGQSNAFLKFSFFISSKRKQTNFAHTSLFSFFFVIVLPFSLKSNTIWCVFAYRPHLKPWKWSWKGQYMTVFCHLYTLGNGVFSKWCKDSTFDTDFKSLCFHLCFWALVWTTVKRTCEKVWSGP